MAEKSIIFKKSVIAYRKKGKGTALVFLHGFLENKSMWKDYFEVLSQTHTVIGIDLPGHGKSEDIAYVHTMEEMAEAVKAVIKHENIRKHYLIGHSMGGYVSMAYAEKYSDALKGVVMFHSTASADTDEKKINRSRAVKVVK
ncbi:MAG: alpha/beta hydrolase, partial [Desulfobacula sp.]|nr:alpha/beta hydrolase [Desulfobacula sp.]